MNAIVPANMGQLSTVFANANPSADDLSAGISGGFGHIGYKGKVWSIRHRGNEVILMRDDGDGPRNSIEIVILKASAAVAKIYYEEGYKEGSTQAPDCYSTNGVTPDVGAQKKQHTACGTCPKNQWGARITNEGKQAKACSDSRRLAVVPSGDIRNEVYGGAMLLRVPAASLQDLAQYGAKMAGLGYPYYAIVTRVSFDPAQAFPKFQFNAVRALTNEEAQLVLEMQNSPEVQRILADHEFSAPQPEAQAQAVASAFEQPPQPAQAQQLSAPAPQPAPAAPAPAAPVTQQVTSGFGPVSAPTPVQPPAENNVVQMPQAAPQPAPQAAAPAPTPAPQAPAEEQTGDAFAAALDAKLGELLPPAS